MKFSTIGDLEHYRFVPIEADRIIPQVEVQTIARVVTVIAKNAKEMHAFTSITIPLVQALLNKSGAVLSKNGLEVDTTKPDLLKCKIFIASLMGFGGVQNGGIYMLYSNLIK